MAIDDHDPSRVYAKLHELYAEAKAVHDASGNALVEIINALSRKAEADGAFLAAFQHLVAQPMTAAPPATDDLATRATQEFPETPPPLPRGYDIPPPNIGDSDEEYEARLREVRERAIGNRPGLDGVMGGRR